MGGLFSKKLSKNMYRSFLILDDVMFDHPICRALQASLSFLVAEAKHQLQAQLNVGHAVEFQQHSKRIHF